MDAGLRGFDTCAALVMLQSHRWELNPRPLDYESSALPLSYCGGEEPSNALARTRTATPCGTTPSRWRVYQFHHQGKSETEATRRKPQGVALILSSCGFRLATGATGLEPATSRVTVECSNQTELRPPLYSTYSSFSCPLVLLSCFSERYSPNGSRTRLSTLKGSRPNR